MGTTENEKFLTKPLLVIFLTIAIDLIGFGMVIPLLKFYAERFDASSLTVGILMAVYSLMQFIFAPVLGGLSDRHGRRPILFLSIVGAGFGYLTVGLAHTLVLVFVGRIIGGITAANLSTAQAYIADVTSRQHRAKGMGLFGMAFGLGFVLGPALTGILSNFGGPSLPFFVAAGMSFVNAGLLYFLLPETVRPGDGHREIPKRGFREILSAMKNKQQAMLNLQYFLLITAFSMMNVAFPYFTDLNYGYKETETGYILAYVGVLSGFVQGGIFARLVRKFGESKLVVAGSLILALGLIVLPYITRDAMGITGLLVGFAVFAFGNSIASPAMTSLGSKLASDADQGKAMGVMQSGASLARVVGPALCGVLLNTVGHETNRDTLRRSMWVAASIMIVTVAVSIYTMASGIHAYEHES